MFTCLEWPGDILFCSSHYYQGQHGQTIEEGGCHHVHVEQLADVPHHNEGDAQDCLDNKNFFYFVLDLVRLTTLH